MGNRLKWVSRLTFFLIFAFIISVCLLTFFSINSISSLKELTEKNILEEKDNLHQKILNSIQRDFEAITNNYINQIVNDGFNQDSLLVLTGRYPSFTFPFHYSRNGEFLYPHFRSTVEGIYRENELNSINNHYQQGESAELIQRNFLKAKMHYQNYLSESENSYDSVKALNAMGRISLKLEKPDDAAKYYGTIISKYPGLLDYNAYPYSYYSISQLLNMADCLQDDTILYYAAIWMKNLYNQEVNLNHSTGPLIERISNILNGEINNNQHNYYPLRKYMDEVNAQIHFIKLLGNLIKEYCNENTHNRSLISINEFRLVEYYSNEGDYLVFISKLSDHHVGFIIDVDKYISSLTGYLLQDEYEFQYTIDFKRIMGAKIADQSNNKFLLNPFVSRYVVGIDLYNSALIGEYVSKRRWVYGVVLTLLLFGMLLVITFILKDISRERQMAALKSDFISNVSHELKSPITSINMFAESMFLDRVKSQTRKKEYLEMIMKESGRLKRMINNILDFSRIESQQQKYSFKEKDISLLLWSVIEEMNFWIKLKKIKLTSDIEDNIIVTMDQEKIRQVLGNIISNAIRYTPESGMINIRLYQKGPHRHIDIEDKGIGIPDDEQSKIFKKFYRVLNEDTEGISGTGLGLAVVKEIVDAHQWEIIVNSKIGKGSIFTLIF